MGVLLATLVVVGVISVLFTANMLYIYAPPYGIPTDPIYSIQWHLNNSLAPKADTGVATHAWQLGYTGKLIAISILDDGALYTSPDLNPNFRKDLSTSFIMTEDDPAPICTDVDTCNVNNHGTRCASVATAVGYNGYCGVGVAPDADFGAVKVFSTSGTFTMSENLALVYGLASVDIYSLSYGVADFSLPNLSVMDAYEAGARSGRGGLGSIYVKAAGNSKSAGCHMDTKKSTSIYVINVGAFGALGDPALYTSECSAVFVGAPSSYSGTVQPRIPTASLEYSAAVNGPVASCTDQNTGFGGTSSATPYVAGVIALMFEANPSLTWRAIQYILVQTSSAYPSTAVYTKNGAGYMHSYEVGFGMINATAAVMAALSPPSISLMVAGFYSTAPIMIGDLKSTVAVTSLINLESVVVNFTSRFCLNFLTITITSPAGTPSVLTRPDITTSDNPCLLPTLFPIRSVRFWGEAAIGEWTLTATTSQVNPAPPPNTPLIDVWNLNLYGKDYCNVACVPPQQCDSTTKQCACRAGYTGPKCDQFSCASKNNCSGNGRCTGPETCTCPVSLPTGVCSGVCATCPSCSRGICTPPSCTDTNYFALQCSSLSSFEACYVVANDCSVCKCSTTQSDLSIIDTRKAGSCCAAASKISVLYTTLLIQFLVAVILLI